ALCGVLNVRSSSDGNYGEEIHDNCPLFNGFFNVKEILSWNPSIFLGLFPGRSILTNPNNDIQSIIPGIQSLSMTLRSVSNKRKRIILEIFLFVNFTGINDTWNFSRGQSARS